MTQTGAPFLEAADRIARRLCRDALWSEGRCNWLGWHTIPLNNAWVPAFKSHGWTLYDGLAGICLFLAETLRFSNDDVERATLRGALQQLQRMVSDVDANSAPGYYAGLCGVTAAYTAATDALGDEAWSSRALAVLERVSLGEPDGVHLDLIRGSAGTIIGLIDGAARFGREAFLDAAERHGRVLLDRARRSEHGWSWDTAAGHSLDHLLGYAHGAGGIATALLELHAATGKDTYASAAAEAVGYERWKFSPANQNWPDLRTLPAMNGQPASSEPRYSIAWCHGAPGVGISRLRIRDFLHDTESDNEIAVALNTTASTISYVAAPGQGNFSLCHGAAGNADFLLIASELLGRPELRQSAESVGNTALAHYHAHDLPWPCGMPGLGENPSLMLGFSGIGHFFLRLHSPEQVRTVLLLKPATAARREQSEHSYATA